MYKWINKMRINEMLSIVGLLRPLDTSSPCLIVFAFKREKSIAKDESFDRLLEALSDTVRVK